ncbi:SDR family NAD(P)-dependent oxidoreductase [Thalassobius sp. S69A]|uniref:SDR family NAD(P)-dependent oxidoreductase n=1 Tax=unclassified Thalassovita TaxID=2619711 RepID=UPI000C121D7E|nr:2-deoxy-D-gluconate 3-dehydrogenase [Paracoccaceae bacterium]MBT26925.1 2-deoxy-D-gluconate 3-dehydrogenase [Paracoccaceae bacterium]
MSDDLIPALITGASSGLGAHFGRVLAANGFHVILAARRKAKVTALADALNAEGKSAEAIELDVANAASVTAAFAAMSRAPDVVINNAGIAGEGTALEMPEEVFTQVLDTNLKGVFLVSQAAARAMKKRGSGGAIVNIASILGLRVAGGVSAYSASKAALVQLTRAQALEWARYGIRVNALCPGYIETPLNRAFFETDPGKALVRRIPQRRLGQLADLDAPLLMLLSPGAAYLTGCALPVDGGHLVSSL